jgi:serine/threonine-protein kinase
MEPDYLARPGGNKMADFVGRMLGPYQITQELGHGGMANVYLAAQPSVGRQVAIKVLPSQFLQDRTFLERFTREVRLIAQLQHPRILPIYDFEQDGVPHRDGRRQAARWSI